MSRVTAVRVLGVVLVLGSTAVLASPQPAEQPAMPPPGEQAPEAMLLSRLHFVHQEQMSLGYLAQLRGQSPAVRTFGASLVSDHDRLDRNLILFAQQAGVEIPPLLPAAPEVRRRIKTLDSLVRKGPQSFENPFLRTSVQRHDEAIAMVEDALRRYQGTKLAAVLSETLSVLRLHRESARAIIQEQRQASARRMPPYR